MISGRKTLATIDQALSDERAKMDRVEQRIKALSAERVERQKEDVRDLRELAKVRVNLLAGGELVRHIDQTEEQVLSLLESRKEAADELAARIRAAEDDRRALEEEREAQADEVDRAAEAVDQAEAHIQERLDTEPEYQAQLGRAKEAERTALHASEKAGNSEQEQEQKGDSYRNDPLFIYLWDRNYGLTEYSANLLIRWLDGKVARLIGFAGARANYMRLNEIPQRLREHAGRLMEVAEAEFQTLKELDTAAREADGIPALETQLEQQQSELDALDERIAAMETEHQELLDQQAAFAAGEDEHTRQAVEYLAAEFRRDDLMELRREALATPFPDDDLIVSRMVTREDEGRQREASIRGLRETREQNRARLSELESLRSEFKRHRYDRSGSSFGDGSLVAMMLSSFLNGMLDRKMLWKVMQEQQRYRPQRSDPTFGSGGFGRGSVWGGGVGDLSDLGNVIGGLGRGGWGGGSGGRRGGFGGGGGGGGFRTGGGF